MFSWTDVTDSYTVPQFDHSALVLIDVQRDFLDGGALPVAGTSERLPQMRMLVEAFRAAGHPIVHVVRLYDGDDVALLPDLPRRATIAAGAPIVRPGSAGSQIATELLPAGSPDLDTDLLRSGHLQPLGDGEFAMFKPRWDAFTRTHLDGFLRSAGVSTVVIAGCNFPNCPRASIYGASNHDFRTLVAADAISGATAERLAELRTLGVPHAESAEIVAALRGDA
ncbi:cysteine hydrolase [Rhodococcus sp. D2-41]|uniref:cysteine hydrolase family protein n=1 Tax=Speluncibacter jeojiensis TaxID=2710754 RepID=UPI00240F5713|nr:isochorismatase family cysteine hydrolase [Rhodococcus sp. D2-41]MDG3009109.1 cysteine hydrolase [Rhodococcus sp. D2-41]